MTRPVNTVRNLHRLVLPAALALCAVGTVHAAVFRISKVPQPMVSLSIGSNGATIDQVSFQVSPGQLGNGIPIVGSPRIRISVLNRALPPQSRSVTLTADSSMPLTNGNSQIPFSSIRWTSKNNTIPSGTFDGSSNQTLLTSDISTLITDRHQFIYANSTVLEAGVYTGRITYTLTMP